MAGRGRGGRGGGIAASRGQFAALGVPKEEYVQVTEPLPAYPPLNRGPLPLQESVEMDYLTILRQDCIDLMQSSGAYLKIPQIKQDAPQQEIDKLLAQLPNVKEKFDWNFFPNELRPKIVPRRRQSAATTKVDVIGKLNKLEQLEGKTKEKDTENKEAMEVDEIEVNYEDEEIDDGTDYGNNYFDNGEGYEDEDDNLDDDAIY